MHRATCDRPGRLLHTLKYPFLPYTSSIIEVAIMIKLHRIASFSASVTATVFILGCSGTSDSGGTTTGTGGSVATGGTVGTGGTSSTGGTSNTGGTTGSTGGITGTGGTTSVAPPPCLADPTQDAAILGDSYVTGAASPALQPALAALYPTAGQFPNYAVAGTSMASGGIPLLPKIPTQFDTAIAAHPTMKFGIMDGGGNDILLCDNVAYPNCNTLCNTTGSSTQKVCQDIVTNALTAASALMVKAANAGVRDTIYFFYPHIPANNGGYKEILDYGEPLAKAACDGAEAATSGKLRCHFVSLIQPFANAGGDMNPANFAGDGIHPSQVGQDIIAGEIWKVMQSQCLGQLSTNSCCAP